MQPFLLLALFLFCGRVISQTEDLKTVCSLATIPQSNVKSYTSDNCSRLSRLLISAPTPSLGAGFQNSPSAERIQGTY